MSNPGKSIWVYAHWQGFEKPKPCGILTAETLKGKESFSFEYSVDWLSSGHAQFLDPDLQLYRGRQFPNPEKKSFGLFLDSAPDRWGRLLMRRREAILARKESRIPVKLDESDFLLGVHDMARMGALRFKYDESGPFLAADSPMTTPPWTKLRELEQASDEFESADEDSLEEKWLAVLLDPGSSLGGARPKVSVIDPAGALWIAKFPAKQDDFDSGAWEMTVHELAVKAGLSVPEARLERFSKRGSTFLVKRFDRTPGNGRIHFASAMTLLGKNDGASAQDGTSYLELVECIIKYGFQPEKDLEELWKRIVFSIAVSNTDDHLRNHGFLLKGSSWYLSPAYDINPSPFGNGLSLNINEHDNSLDFELALKAAPWFHLDAKKSRSLLDEIRSAVAPWKKMATDYGISRTEINRMKAAFHE